MKKLLFVIALVAIGLSAKAQNSMQIYLTNDGFGIGINNPAQKLHVVGNGYFDGNVGIGTATVSNTQGWGRVLDIYNSNNSKLLVRNSNVKVGLFAHNSWGGIVGVVGTESNHDLRLMTNYNHVMTLTTTGNVGIEKSNPAYKLDVYGEGRFGVGSGLGYGVILGTYNYSCYGTIFSKPAVYGVGLFLGTPNRWAEATFSTDIYYTWLWKRSSGDRIDLCTRPALVDIAQIQAYRMETAEPRRGDFTIGQAEYVFDPVELQAVFPELVSVIDTCGGDSSGYAINYIGMIPILTKAINEQQVLIEEQQGEIDQLQGTVAQLQTEVGILQDIVVGQELDLTVLYELQDEVGELRYIVNMLQKNCCKDIIIPPYDRDSNHNKQSQIIDEAILYQNTPNPFSTNTEIFCYVPVITTNAFIYIYNLQGVELMSFPVTQTGISTVYVHASALPAGMYLYTLVVDGVIIDTKRMILTK